MGIGGSTNGINIVMIITTSIDMFLYREFNHVNIPFLGDGQYTLWSYDGGGGSSGSRGRVRTTGVGVGRQQLYDVITLTQSFDAFDYNIVGVINDFHRPIIATNQNIIGMMIGRGRREGQYIGRWDTRW